jgi:TetR/AcrR family transcriptional regulator, transcriptional repressor for nem operon
MSYIGVMARAVPLSPPPSRSPGRPREFDMDEALDKAVRVFCERGYHATSIGDLTNAMQLASGSVYKAFKDKRAVFLAAFDRYKVVRDQELLDVIRTGKTGLDRIRKALTFFVEASHGAEGRRGCLVVGSAAELATFDEEIAQRVATAIDKKESLMAELIRQGQSDGSIPTTVDSNATAQLMLCLLQGMRVVGKIGRTRTKMLGVVDIAMKTLV